MSPSAYVLRLERHGLAFAPGQYVTIGLPGDVESREYSIYSGADDPFLEVLIKEVKGGSVSRSLRHIDIGARLDVTGPYGFFVLGPESAHALLFVASGTGIAPFHAMVRSRPSLDYQLLHGVRSIDECYDSESYRERYRACVSRGAGGFQGRVTDYLARNPVDPSALCYLCGNGAMIFAAFDILKGQGLPSEHLFAEVYF